MGSQFDGKLSPRGFDLSYDMSPPKDYNLNRINTKMNESWNANNISRITGAKLDISNSNFIDDSRMMELL